ncbi:hypothetical protein UA08_09225 [Talaromyces atroroseus]|uniref:Zn(2)-C6 fungal-type domain-containing protein n=1 Tax=Talaromyces atroroseus TaxID=1441469 RepID=A0A1Q5Q718_TALAT|nr:hypothetical protein UA08_09225 [Talaromyces atroroseus]OKL55481.1 hypothetical protein UA08_09225 [Talaromyces atroroseus]
MRPKEASVYQRTLQACRTCRRRKTKCDGARPKCRHCSSRNIPCEWPGGGAAIITQPTVLSPTPTAPDLTPGQSVLPETSSYSSSLGPEALSSILPSREALQRCFAIFYEKHLATDFCSFLYKPQFEAQVASNKFLVTAIICLCSRYLTYEEARVHYGRASAQEVQTSFTNISKRLSREAMDQPSVPNIQGNLVLSLSELLADAGSGHWMYSGVAIRMAQMMRLNKEYHQKHSEQEREIRRRTFWACLLQDRFLAYYLAKPHTLAVRSIAVCLPSNDIALAYGEVTRGMTLNNILDQFNVNPLSDTGILPYLLKTLELWGEMADWYVYNERIRGDLSPIDPLSRFARLSASLQIWEDTFSPPLRWSDANYQMHTKLDQGRAFVSLHCLLRGGWCIMHQDYLPQTDGDSILLDFTDPAGWSLLHREPSLISTCLSNALSVGEIVASYIESDHQPSIFVAVAILSAASPLLWIQYNQDPQEFHAEKARAGDYFDNFLSLFMSWRDVWNVAGEWTKQLEKMQELYRYAYLGEVNFSNSTATESATSAEEASIPESVAQTSSPEYRPKPGDGIPQGSAPSLYMLLRMNRITNLDLRAEYESSIWSALMRES